MFNFKRSLSIKILVSLICVAILFGSFAVSPVASAFNYPKITLSIFLYTSIYNSLASPLKVNSKKWLL